MSIKGLDQGETYVEVVGAKRESMLKEADFENLKTFELIGSNRVWSTSDELLEDI